MPTWFVFFSFQGSLSLILSRATTYIEYHHSYPISVNRFLNFFKFLTAIYPWSVRDSNPCYRPRRCLLSIIPTFTPLVQRTFPLTEILKRLGKFSQESFYVLTPPMRRSINSCFPYSALIRNSLEVRERDNNRPAWVTFLPRRWLISSPSLTALVAFHGCNHKPTNFKADISRWRSPSSNSGLHFTSSYRHNMPSWSQLFLP